MNNKSTTKVVIVVLGDIGHSPRMCNHAYSFASMDNVEVELFGYLNSKPHQKIVNNEKIRFKSNHLIINFNHFLKNSSIKFASIHFIQSNLANKNVDASFKINLDALYFDEDGN